jgi:hypothetical protein
MKSKIDELYEEYKFYQEYLDYLQAFQQEEIKRDLEKIAREIVKTKIEQAIFSIVIQSVDDPAIASAYIASFQVVGIGSRNIINFSPSTPLVQYLEAGVQSFSLKEKLLAQGSTKISKAGFAYRDVPLRRNVDGGGAERGKMDAFQKTAGRIVPIESQNTVLTSKEIAIQSNINKVLQKAKFSFIGNAKDAEGRTVKKSISRDQKDLGTLIKEETVVGGGEKTEKVGGYYRKNGAYVSPYMRAMPEKVVKTKYVIFRRISARPGTADWIHPGFPGKNVYKQIIDWQNENEEQLFENTLNSLLEEAFGAL